MASSRVPEYKAILVKNRTNNATVFLFLYFESDPICWLSMKKESIEPGKQYFHRDENAFKYELRIQQNGPRKEKRTIILPVNKWIEDKLIFVYDNADKGAVVDERLLKEYPEERQICVRRKNMDDETSVEYGRDLYGVLKLNMKQVRKETVEEQDKIIRKAYHRQMLLFHPDRNPDVADHHITQEIIMAYSILGDREKRAKYHDLTDYSGGWLTKSRWSAIFTPEAHGNNEKWKRIGLLVFSAAMVAGGVLITVFTGGLGFPIFISGNMATGALIGGAIQGAIRTVSYDSIENGVQITKYAKSFAIGAALGAAAGGACAGITSAMIGIENTVASIAEAGAGEMVGTGAATGSVNGVLTSIPSDVESYIVDGETKSIGEVATHALKGAIVGSGVGMVCSGLAKAEAKVRVLGKTKTETVKEQMFVAECTKHIALARDYTGKPNPSR